MSGISSSTGLISGINSSAIIDQLLQVEGRPKLLIQQHVAQLQTQQAAFLSLNSAFNGLKAAAQKLRLNKLFDAATTTSSNADVLTGVASAGAPAGNYSFLVDRTVSTHQLLSRGFVDRNTSGVGLTSLTFESTKARLDSDAQLSSLNGGAGISRGKVVVTNRAGVSTTIDLSRAASVSEVLDAFNNNTDAHVSASVDGGRLVLTDNSGGGGSLVVRSAAGYTTAASLGIDQTVAGASLTGSLISYLGDNTTIQSLNDSNGIRISSDGGTGGYDFSITARDGTAFNVDIGDIYTARPDGTTTKTASAVTTIGQLRARIESQTSGKVTVQTTPDGDGIRLVDTTGGTSDLIITDRTGSAADLGFVSAKGATANFAAATADSKALLAELGSRLTSNIRGGRGLSNGAISITARDGTISNFSLNTTGSISDLLQSFSAGTAGKVTAALDSDGTSIILTDTTGGSSNFNVGGAAALDLGIFTALGGVASSTLKTTKLDRQYIAESTQLASLNGGHGVGTGSFKIIGADGTAKTVIIGTNVQTVGDLISAINAGSNNGAIARINDAGNGIIVEKDPAFVGADQKISISDTSGAVARSLNLVGTASALGTGNSIDGSFRISVNVTATDTLDQVIGKINSSRAGVNASVVTDGSSGAPFRLKFTANDAGDAGQFQASSSGEDLALALVSQGGDARVFYGSDDPARAILIKRNSNSVDGVIDGLRADIHTASATPVTLTVSRDTDSTLSAIQDFVTAFNGLSAKISDLTKYNADTETRGTLLGDSTTLALQSELYNTLQGSGLGIGGQYTRLAQVGLKVNRDGTIAIDADKLRTALQNDPASVKDLFSGFSQDAIPANVEIPGITGVTVVNTATQGVFTKLGVLERIAALADKYTDSTSGVLTARGKSLDSQIAADNARISDYDDRLAAKRTILENQFAAMETTLSKLQGQQSSLSGIKGLT